MNLFPAVISFIALAISIWGYFHHHKRARFNIMEQSFDALQRINEKALESDLNLLAAIQSANPMDKTPVDEARIIYFHYMRINRIFKAYEYRRGRFISQRQANRIMQPHFGALKGAMPKFDAIMARGYPEDFTVWLKKKIEKSEAPSLLSIDSAANKQEPDYYAEVQESLDKKESGVGNAPIPNSTTKVQGPISSTDS